MNNEPMTNAGQNMNAMSNGPMAMGYNGGLVDLHGKNNIKR